MASSISQHVVIPGQVIATSTESDHDGGFLRGHGTYIETNTNINTTTNTTTNLNQTQQDGSNNIQMEHNNNNNNNHNDEDEEMEDATTTTTTTLNPQNSSLIASTTGVLERTNKLITVQPLNTPYSPQPGDPIIGRVTSITNQYWKISLHTNASSNTGVAASLPLTGIFLQDSTQRMRTAADALKMRTILMEGDLVSAEVRNVGQQGGGRVTLHARSVRCGRLENGCVVFAPSYLIGRRKKNFVVLGGGGKGGQEKDDVDMHNNRKMSTGEEEEEEDVDGFEGVSIEVLLGCNGGIWIQRALLELENLGTETPLPEVVQRIRMDHAQTPLLLKERRVVARVRNAVEALKLLSCRITPENIEKVVKMSAVDLKIPVKDMLRPDNVVRITADTRMNQ